GRADTRRSRLVALEVRDSLHVLALQQLGTRDRLFDREPGIAGNELHVVLLRCILEALQDEIRVRDLTGEIDESDLDRGACMAVRWRRGAGDDRRGHEGCNREQHGTECEQSLWGRHASTPSEGKGRKQLEVQISTSLKRSDRSSPTITRMNQLAIALTCQL